MFGLDYLSPLNTSKKIKGKRSINNKLKLHQEQQKMLCAWDATDGNKTQQNSSTDVFTAHNTAMGNYIPPQDLNQFSDEDQAEGDNHTEMIFKN